MINREEHGRKSPWFILRNNPRISLQGLLKIPET
jgi:hypothetical protein